MSITPMVDSWNPARDQFRIIIDLVDKVESSNLASGHNLLI